MRVGAASPGLGLLLTLGLAPPLLGQRPSPAAPPACPGGIDAPRFDHVVIAVRDLPAAVTYYRDTLGFSIKPGYSHPNGIENAHVKFADGSALELLTARNPTDAVARAYVKYLADQEGGAYVALDAGPVDGVAARVREVGVTPLMSRQAAFDWVSFPEHHALHGVFFIDTHSRSADQLHHLTHDNGAMGLASVVLRVGDRMLSERVLTAVGARPCGENDGRARFGLASGRLIVQESVLGPRVPRVTIRVRDLPVTTERLGVTVEGTGRIRLQPREAFGVVLEFVERRGAAR